MITPTHYLVVAALLFCLGLYGALTRRNAIAVLMSIELMFNAANLNLIAFSRLTVEGYLRGQIFPFFVIAVAAAEAVVGLAIILALYRTKQVVNLDEAAEMKW